MKKPAIKRKKLLLHGENPYQTPSHFIVTDNKDRLGLGKFKQLSGAVPCYTNMADFDSILIIIGVLSNSFYAYYKKIPYIAVAAKHGNPCGIAVDWKNPAHAVKKALWGNPTAVWGGEVIINFDIDTRIAQLLRASKKRGAILGNSRWMLDLIAAPRIHHDAVCILSKNPKRKLFTNTFLYKPFFNNAPWIYRTVRGGYLRQPPHNYILDLKSLLKKSKIYNENLVDTLIIAWSAAWFSNHGGNEVAVAKNRTLFSIGGGPSTVDACETALYRAKAHGHDTRGSVFAADAFFPFTDAPKILVKNGCRSGIVPDGGKNKQLVKQFFTKHKLAVWYLPELCRGFFKH